MNIKIHHQICPSVNEENHKNSSKHSQAELGIFLFFFWYEEQRDKRERKVNKRAEIQQKTEMEETSRQLLKEETSLRDIALGSLDE